MKLNTLLMSATLATASMFTATAYADSTTRVAAASALGSVAGTAIGKNMGGTTGATIGAALGGAGGAAVASDKRHRTESAICLLYTSPSPRDKRQSRMPSSA